MFDAIVLLLYVNVVGVSNGIVARMDWERSPTASRAGSVGVFSFRGKEDDRAKHDKTGMDHQ